MELILGSTFLFFGRSKKVFDPWEGGVGTYVAAYKEGIEEIVQKISGKIFEKLFFKYQDGLGVVILNAKGHVIAQIAVYGECGGAYKALITTSSLFPRSLEDDIKKVFHPLRVEFENDQIVVIKDKPLTLLLELPPQCLPDSREAAKVFTETIEGMYKRYPHKKFTLLPFSSSVLAIEK